MKRGDVNRHLLIFFTINKNFYLTFTLHLIIIHKVMYLGVAQFGSVLEWGSRGREFKSPHSDQKNIVSFWMRCFFYLGRLELKVSTRREEND